MQENICLTMEIPKIATTALLARSVRTVRLRALLVKMGSTQMQQPKLPVVPLAAQESTVIKIFSIPKHRVKVVLRGNTPRPKVLQVVMAAMIARQASIQRLLWPTVMKTCALIALRTRTVQNKEEIRRVTPVPMVQRRYKV